MLWTIIGALLAVWLLLIVAVPAIGGAVHLLLILALILLVLQLLTGRTRFV